ncbi:TPA: hypothetical protein HA246_06120 [Candidatus Woesearchaeota archaeon]|nr:hypothetical protein [Candidatus Woesearchaeota archaeon]
MQPHEILAEINRTKSYIALGSELENVITSEDLLKDVKQRKDYLDERLKSYTQLLEIERIKAKYNLYRAFSEAFIYGYFHEMPVTEIEKMMYRFIDNAVPHYALDFGINLEEARAQLENYLRGIFKLEEFEDPVQRYTHTILLYALRTVDQKVKSSSAAEEDPKVDSLVEAVETYFAEYAPKYAAEAGLTLAEAQSRIREEIRKEYHPEEYEKSAKDINFTSQNIFSRTELIKSNIMQSLSRIDQLQASSCQFYEEQGFSEKEARTIVEIEADVFKFYDALREHFL